MRPLLQPDPRPAPTRAPAVSALAMLRAAALLSDPTLRAGLLVRLQALAATTRALGAARTDVVGDALLDPDGAPLPRAALLLQVQATTEAAAHTSDRAAPDAATVHRADQEVHAWATGALAALPADEVSTARTTRRLAAIKQAWSRFGVLVGLAPSSVFLAGIYFVLVGLFRVGIGPWRTGWHPAEPPRVGPQF